MHFITQVERRKEKYWKKVARLMREGGGSERSWQSLRKKWGNVKTQANVYKLKRRGGTGKARWQCIFILMNLFHSILELVLYSPT